jgi:hypothetical protein
LGSLQQPARANNNSDGTVQSPDAAPPNNPQATVGPFSPDDFAGLSYTADQKAEIDKILRDTEFRKNVVEKAEKLTQDQKNAMLVGYSRLAYGAVFKVLSPEQQRQVRKRIIARRAADRAVQKRPPAPN